MNNVQINSLYLRICKILYKIKHDFQQLPNNAITFIRFALLYMLYRVCRKSILDKSKGGLLLLFTMHLV